MALASKVLWIVDMKSDAIETAFAKHALAIGATAVCVRTSSKRLPDAIKRFHDIGIKVLAWRWPPASKAGAENEANNVAKNLIPAGLDGYVVDPESDKAGAANDWNRQQCAPIAARFCTIIKNAAPANFVFGTTSGCSYPAPNMKPNGVLHCKRRAPAADVLALDKSDYGPERPTNKRRDARGENGP
jgi:hypothetical protein